MPFAQGRKPLQEADAFCLVFRVEGREQVVYRLDVNHYRDARTAQLVVEHLESV